MYVKDLIRDSDGKWNADLLDALVLVLPFIRDARDKLSAMFAEPETSSSHAVVQDSPEFAHALNCMIKEFEKESYQFGAVVPESPFDFAQDPDFLVKVKQHWAKIRRDKGFIDVDVSGLVFAMEKEGEESDEDIMDLDM